VLGKVANLHLALCD
jgi:hypothetical protein